MGYFFYIMINRVIHISLIVVLGIHFGVIALCLFPECPITKMNKTPLNAYFQYFMQNWKMFSPPPDYNLKLRCQYVIHHKNSSDTTDFYDIISGLKKHQWDLKTRGMMRVVYYINNSCSEYMDADFYLKRYLGKTVKSADSATVYQKYRKYMGKTRSVGRLIAYANYSLDRIYKVFAVDNVDSVSTRLLITKEYFNRFEQRNDTGVKNDVTPYFTDYFTIRRYR